MTNQPKTTAPKTEHDNAHVGDPTAAEIIDKQLSVNAEHMGEDERALLAMLDRDQVAWNPDPGQRVVGKVLSIVPAQSEYGIYPLLSIDVPSGPIAQVHCFHTILRSEIDKLRVAEGDTIAIQYLGRSGDRDMARYRVQLRRGKGGRTYDPSVAPVAVDEEPF